MWTSTQYRNVVRGSAWYDLIVTAAFATPWSFAALHGVLTALSQKLNLPGELPPFEPVHLLMANLLGSAAGLWAACLGAPSYVGGVDDVGPGPRRQFVGGGFPGSRSGVGHCSGVAWSVAVAGRHGLMSGLPRLSQ